MARQKTERSFFVPYAYRRARPADPRTLPADCVVVSMPQLRATATPAKVLFLHLEDLVGKLDDGLLGSLGDVVSAMSSLQTMVLRKCGVTTVGDTCVFQNCNVHPDCDGLHLAQSACLLAYRMCSGWYYNTSPVVTSCNGPVHAPSRLEASVPRTPAGFAPTITFARARCALPSPAQLERFQLPKLLQCDLSSNNIRSLTTVEDFARRSLELLHLDIAHNPLLLSTAWKVRFGKQMIP
jgi:hypothetical protein